MIGRLNRAKQSGKNLKGLCSMDLFFLNLTSESIKKEVESGLPCVFGIGAASAVELTAEQMQYIYKVLLDKEVSTSKTYQLNTIESTKDKQLFFYFNEIIEAIKNNKSITLVLSDSDIQTNK
jgi:hypothetical protein